MKKLILLATAAAGYVLGARAGRERYEQIMRQADKVRNNVADQGANEQPSTITPGVGTA